MRDRTDDERPQTPEERDVTTAAWRDEIAARLDRYDRGETTAIPWREALAESRARLKAKNE